MWRRLLLTLAIVLVPVALLAYGLRGDPRSVPSPLVGTSAPEFSLPALGGGQAKLADFRGRVLVLNFWASWCVPCREEAPALEAMWQHYRDRGVAVIGVNIQDQEPAAREFMAATRTTFPNVVDARGLTSIAYGIYGVPETFVIDRAGRIRFKQIGAADVKALARELEPLLASGS